MKFALTAVAVLCIVSPLTVCGADYCRSIAAAELRDMTEKEMNDAYCLVTRQLKSSISALVEESNGPRDSIDIITNISVCGEQEDRISREIKARFKKLPDCAAVMPAEPAKSAQ